MMITPPTPPNLSTPTSRPAGMPQVDVVDQTSFDTALNRMRTEAVYVNVREGLTLTGKHLLNWQPDPMKRSYMVCPATTKEKMAKVVNPGLGLAMFIQGPHYVTWDGFSFEGSVWGFALGAIGGTTHPRIPVHGLQMRRVGFSSNNEAALLIQGNSYNFSIEDFWVAKSGREGIYFGYGNPGSVSELDRPHDFVLRRGDIANFGKGPYAGAEGLDWKPGAYNWTGEDLYFHDGVVFSQGAITASGPNDLGAWGSPLPSGTIRRVAIGHVKVAPGRSPLDASGVYLSMPGVNIEDLLVFDIDGAAVNQGRSTSPDMAGVAPSRISGLRAAGCRGGVINLSGWGYTGIHPKIDVSRVRSTVRPVEGNGVTVTGWEYAADPAGLPSSWTPGSFGTVVVDPPPPPPPPPPSSDVEARIVALETSMKDALLEIADLVVDVEALKSASGSHERRLDGISTAALG